jgi:hypothetical protein
MRQAGWTDITQRDLLAIVVLHPTSDPEVGSLNSFLDMRALSKSAEEIH